MSLLGSILKNTFFLTMGQLAGKFLTVILVAFLARAIGPEGVGKYAFCSSLIALFLIFTDFGFDLLLVREVAKSTQNNNEFIGNILIIKIAVSIIASLFLFLYAALIGYDRETKQIIFLLLISHILTSIITTFYSIFRAYEKMEFQAIIILVQNSLRVMLGIAAFKIKNNLSSILCGLLLADVICFLGGAYFIHRNFIPFKFKANMERIKSILISAIPFGILSLVSVVWTNTDNLMLGTFVGEIAVGWYSAANKLLMFVLLIPNMFMNAIFPLLSRLSVSDKSNLSQTYSKSFYYMLMLAFPVAVGGFLLSDQIILMIYGADFKNTILIFQILMWVTMFSFVGYVNGATLNAIGKEKLFSVTYGLFTLGNVVLTYFFIKRFGYIGPCLSALILTFLGFIIYSIICHTHLGIKPEWLIMGKSLIASMLMGVMLFILKGILKNSLILIPVGAVTYLGLIYLLKVLPNEDVKAFLKLFEKRQVGRMLGRYL